jgi:hypothetical protein
MIRTVRAIRTEPLTRDVNKLRVEERLPTTREDPRERNGVD